jgi:hypothetical protein
MNFWILFVMAALGIGGGFLGLWWGWRESEWQAARRRVYYGQILIDGRWMELAAPTDFNLRSGDYVQVYGSLASDGVYRFRWSEFS